MAVIDAAPIDGAAGSDAAPPDGPGLTCPNNYQRITGLTSRYRLTGPGHYRQRHDDCANDQPGNTHLVVLDTVAESDQLRLSFNQDWWVGAVQAPAQPLAAPADGWFQITGGPLPAALWAAGQPNDADSAEDDEQHIGLRRADGLEDEAGTVHLPGLCECDGAPIDATVEGYIPDTG